MIFNEIYSAYYNTVAKIISTIISGDINEKILEKIVEENAFAESGISVISALKNEKWQLVHPDLTTPLKHIPTMPLTTMEKQWLKAISLDPRIKLFDVNFIDLDDVEPLFTPEDFYIYDKYCDGDNYDDEKYIKNFKIILKAIRTKQNLKIKMISRKGKEVFGKCIPEKIEYSEKDDKFRLVTKGCRFLKTVNLSRITKCKICSEDIDLIPCPAESGYETVTLKVSEERNTLERCLLHFANFEKRAEKSDDYYLLHIKFSCEDENEMVIRVLSFGPTVEVVEPENFRELIIKKLKSQKSCENF